MASQKQVDFYRKQRLDAEKAADGGDRGAAGTAAKIYGKLGGAYNGFDPSANNLKAAHYGYQSAVGKTGARILDAGDAVGRSIMKAGGLGGLVDRGAAAGVGGLLSKVLRRGGGKVANGSQSLAKAAGDAKPAAKGVAGAARKAIGAAKAKAPDAAAKAAGRKVFSTAEGTPKRVGGTKSSPPSKARPRAEQAGRGADRGTGKTVDVTPKAKKRPTPVGARALAAGGGGAAGIAASRKKGRKGK